MLDAVEYQRRTRRWLMVAAPAELPSFRYLRRRGWRLRRQVGGDLGQRMASATAYATRAGQSAILVGSDIRDVDARDIQHARDHLAGGADVVLGPVSDGGYWLIGLASAQPELFRAITWSTDTVCRLTVAKAFVE